MESSTASDADPENEPLRLGTPAAVLSRPTSAAPTPAPPRPSAATLTRISEAAAIAAVEAFYGR